MNTYRKLYEALIAARDHLDYCGYGDSWERECSEGLPQQIEEALIEAEKELNITKEKESHEN